jgi:hypothetical protein
MEETSTHLEEPPTQQHSCSDYASWEIFRDAMAIFHDLVFSVCKDVDELIFQLELLDK